MSLCELPPCFRLFNYIRDSGVFFLCFSCRRRALKINRLIWFSQKTQSKRKKFCGGRIIWNTISWNSGRALKVKVKPSQSLRNMSGLVWGPNLWLEGHSLKGHKSTKSPPVSEITTGVYNVATRLPSYHQFTKLPQVYQVFRSLPSYHQLTKLPQIQQVTSKFTTSSLTDQ